MDSRDRKRHNATEAVKALEFLIEIERDPESRARYQAQLDEQKRLLDGLADSAAAGS